MNTQECRWVVGSFQGERAKSVLAHAATGLGYKVLQQNGHGPGAQVIAAFRCPIMPIPEHLTEIVDPFKIQQLEKRRKQ